MLVEIIYAHAYTHEHQHNLLLGLAAKMSEEPFRLLIVDSVIALFRVDFSGRGELADCQQKLAQMLSRLLKLAEEFNVAVYMTNQDLKYYDGDLEAGRSHYFRSLEVRRNTLNNNLNNPSQVLDIAVSLAKAADVDTCIGNEDAVVSGF